MTTSQEEKREIREAKEDLEQGYININLWRRQLAREKVYLEGELWKCRQCLKELATEKERLESLEYPEKP